MKEEIYRYQKEWNGYGEEIIEHFLDSFFDQYQPERSKREDFDCLAKEFLNTLVDDRGGNWETENGYILGVENFAKFLNQRCGALNIVETQ